MDGDSCESSTATPILMEELQGTVTRAVPTNVTIPLSDDTRSDILGAYQLDPTDDTFQRYISIIWPSAYNITLIMFIVGT